MITLTTEQAQQIEEALVKIADLRNLGKIQPEVIAFETLYVIRAARAQEQAEPEQYPTYGFCPICGSRGISRERRINGNDTCANGHSYASNLALHIAPEKQAEQPVSQEYQDHLVNQSFDWAAMAAKHQFMEGYRIGIAEMREKCAKVREEKRIQMNYSEAPYNQCAAAIRAIKFEGDTGFRPVSEMIAEHKQDPKKAAAIEKAKMRKAEQEPVAYTNKEQLAYLKDPRYQAAPMAMWSKPFDKRVNVSLYAAPVQQVDLTDDELLAALKSVDNTTARLTKGFKLFARAVIAADREKNK